MAGTLKSKGSIAVVALVAVLALVGGQMAFAGHTANPNVALTGCLVQGDLVALRPGNTPRVDCAEIPIGPNNHARQVSFAGAGQISALEAEIAELEARIAALEGGGGGTTPPEVTTTTGVGTTTIPPTTIVSGASIAITKTPATQEIASGGTAAWNITVTNDGTEDLFFVEVDDPLAINCEAIIGTLTVGAVHGPYSCTLADITAPMTNTATALAEDSRGNPVSSQATADVTIAP